MHFYISISCLWLHSQYIKVKGLGVSSLLAITLRLNPILQEICYSTYTLNQHFLPGSAYPVSPPISPIPMEHPPMKQVKKGPSHLAKEGRTIHVSLPRPDDLEISATSTPSPKTAENRPRARWVLLVQISCLKATNHNMEKQLVVSVLCIMLIYSPFRSDVHVRYETSHLIS